MERKQPTIRNILQNLADDFYLSAVQQIEKDPTGWTVLPLGLYRYIAERGLRVREQRRQQAGLYF